MKITIGLSRADVDVVRMARIIADSKVEYFAKKELSEEGLTQEEKRVFSNWEERQKLFNKMEALIDSEIDTAESFRAKEIFPGFYNSSDADESWEIPGQAEGIKIPARRRILPDKEKKGLRDEDVFMREYGLYTSFVADEYWSGIFKAIYGYSPSLL